jgi:imidazole glycerol-phosphate synthase subunit HisH
MTVLVVDYGMGNLASVARALEDCGARVVVSSECDAVHAAERIVLPGVGAFPDAMQRLHSAGWVAALRDAAGARRLPIFGICLGMQLLADEGEEGKPVRGLGLIPGAVRRVAPAAGERVPHVGWNEVSHARGDTLLADIPDGEDFYFVHAYHFVCADPGDIAATTPFGGGIASVISRRNVYGAQFHPEKSSRPGRQMLRNFLAAPHG